MDTAQDRDPIDRFLAGLLRNVWFWVGVVGVVALLMLYLIIPSWEQDHRTAILDLYRRFSDSKDRDLIITKEITQEAFMIVHGHRLHAGDLAQAYGEMQGWADDHEAAIQAELAQRQAIQYAEAKLQQKTRAANDEAARQERSRREERDREDLKRDLGNGIGQKQFIGQSRSDVRSLLGPSTQHTISTSGIGDFETDEYRFGRYMLSLSTLNGKVTEATLIEVGY